MDVPTTAADDSPQYSAKAHAKPTLILERGPPDLNGVHRKGGHIPAGFVPEAVRRQPGPQSRRPIGVQALPSIGPPFQAAERA